MDMWQKDTDQTITLARVGEGKRARGREDQEHKDKVAWKALGRLISNETATRQKKRLKEKRSASYFHPLSPPIHACPNKHQKLSMSKNEEGSSDESDIDSEDVVCFDVFSCPPPPTLTDLSSSSLRKKTFHFWWAWTLMRWRLDLHLNTSVKRQLKQPYNWEVLRAH